MAHRVSGSGGGDFRPLVVIKKNGCKLGPGNHQSGFGKVSTHCGCVAQTLDRKRGSQTGTLILAGSGLLALPEGFSLVPTVLHLLRLHLLPGGADLESVTYLSLS